MLARADGRAGARAQRDDELRDELHVHAERRHRVRDVEVHERRDRAERVAAQHGEAREEDAEPLQVVAQDLEQVVVEERDDRAADRRRRRRDRAAVEQVRLAQLVRPRDGEQICDSCD